MATPFVATLADRAVLTAEGPDTSRFLQGLITADVGRIDSGRAAYAALLTPQGKILFDFFVVKAGERYLIDCAADRAGELLKRLMFYRLRAKVDLAADEVLAVAALWNGTTADEPGNVREVAGGVAFADPRTPAMGSRVIAPAEAIAAFAGSLGAQAASAADYHAHRIALGLADSADIGSGELFPHECNFDQIGGVDFRKGCYVGQEVVSRTEHRGTARKRIVPAVFDGGAPERGSAVTAGERAIGEVMSVAGDRGLVLVRLDRAEAAIAAGAPLTAGGATLRLERPDWARFEVPGVEAA